ncbi:MAG: autotransporter outer membrane beta-barrel domain-containing protein, partial [Hyphomicrobiales bacterium]
TSEVFLAYGPTPAEPATPFDDVLIDSSPSAADNVSIWLDTAGQGILPLSTTPERGWQVNITGGLSVRVTPDLLIGALAGRESFSYRSDDTGATLSGDGTSLGAYAGWDIGGRVLVSLGVINTALDYRTSAGNASGAFQASRWLVTGDISGEFTLGDFAVQPSATLLGVWESQDAYIDTLLGTHDARQFGSASASAGIRISRALPISEDWELAPYVGAYLETDAEATIGDGEATYGVAGRLTAGASLTSVDNLYIGLDGGISGIGTDTLTLSARGNLRSSF